jgi:hypothetical protein
LSSVFLNLHLIRKVGNQIRGLLIARASYHFETLCVLKTVESVVELTAPKDTVFVALL